MSDAFDTIYGQPKVREYLRTCVASGKVSQAYLFTGMAGSNKTAAAYAFAEEILKSDTADANEKMEIRRKVTRRVHPDVRYVVPEGAQGYLVEQIREIVSDCAMAPVQAKRKVYILDRVDLMGTSPANAFLKTLEEPPSDVVFLLLGRTSSAVLSTIVSRCQVVPFRNIPASEATAILVQNSQASTPQAMIAIQACNGSVTKGLEFLKSPERQAYRDKVLLVLASLARADDLDVLSYASDIVSATKTPLDAVRREQERTLEESSEFLQRSALKALEARQKRLLSQASFELLRQMTSVVRSWLRDVAVVCAGTPDLVLNIDAADAIRDAARHTTVEAACKAEKCVDAAEVAITYNVSPQVSIEAMLFEIREVLYA
ncbi:DNA polymerase III subunit tau [Slackia heliotrinireducens]|uniref:DNA polymerase III, gamma/tau subunit n=1 Tax=Slackia heliotrinireducens (strain ATCC 29202 / DSM 20476 / NCTC 11029 / RHS 1) TaxID=471855 RepID=C7N6V2_SLAHD|nr:DNA polymerase III subunit delta' [Slackia heliotrinireducens]ACV22637.1 DNA polymerase III, gamma/tau subunit [Slackia heliotrinireducens DSM 20476]VEH01182.1 DNA polymerase III subunit tau [Slackia heliotrinireducens]